MRELSLPATREDHQIAVGLADLHLAVSCMGDDQVAVRLRTTEEELKRFLKRECEAARQLPPDKPAFLDHGPGKRAYVSFSWLLSTGDYAPIRSRVLASVRWLAMRAKGPTEAGRDSTGRSAFLAWVEELMRGLAQRHLNRKSVAIVGEGSERHYRTLTVATHQRLGIDAKEMGRGAPLIRVHLLSNKRRITDGWAAGPELPEPLPPKLGRPRHRVGSREGSQQYFGYQWSNDPIDYDAQKEHVRAAAEYLVEFAKNSNEP